MQIDSTPWRRALILGVPLVVLVLELFHPVDWSADVHGTEVIARDPAWWTILHIVQLPLFGLLGVSVFALTWGMAGRSVWASRIGVLLFLVFYSAHDSITGIASGILIWEAEELPEAEADLVATQVESLFLGGGPYTFIPLTGMLGWALAVGAAAVALNRSGLALLPTILLFSAAIVFGITHEPPFGPIGLAALLLAITMIEFMPGRAWTRSAPNRAGI